MAYGHWASTASATALGGRSPALEQFLSNLLNLILDRFGGEVRADMLKGVYVLADAVAVNIFTRL